MYMYYTHTHTQTHKCTPLESGAAGEEAGPVLGTNFSKVSAPAYFLQKFTAYANFRKKCA